MINSILKENKIINLIRRCLSSNWMILSLVLLTAISNIFGLEIFIYYLFTIIIIVTTLLCDDMLPIFPLSCFAYLTFAKNNNPLSKEQSSIFLSQYTITHLITIISIISICLITRLIFDLITKKERRKKPKLLLGFILLGISYIIGGLLTEYYSFKTILFGLLQIISLSFIYFYFHYTIDWKKVNKDYFAILFTFLGLLMFIEVFNMLVESNFFSTQGAFNRGNLYTGWGIYNNIALVCMLTIPAPFYFACTKKNGWIYSLIGTLFLVTTIFTQSRNGILMGSIIYSICVLFTIFKSKEKERIKNIITFTILLLLLITTIIIFKEELINMFFGVYTSGTNDSGRFEIYKTGFNHYIENPIFGNGFYKCDSFRWGIPYTEKDFFPPRYHNTYIQILSSAGTIGILAYLFHRLQTIKLFFKTKNIQNQLIAITLLGFLLMGLLDCHFHNFGPGLIYSTLLLLSENLYSQNETKKAISK